MFKVTIVHKRDRSTCEIATLVEADSVREAELKAAQWFGSLSFQAEIVAVTTEEVEEGPLRIRTQAELRRTAEILGVRPDWHEPDEQGVTVQVLGTQFDNAGFWGMEFLDEHAADRAELFVVLIKDGRPVAEVNLATLFAWAAVPEDGR